MKQFIFICLFLLSSAVMAQEKSVSQKRVNQKPKALKAMANQTQTGAQEACADLPLDQVTSTIIKQNSENLNFRVFMIKKTYDDAVNSKLGKRIAMLQLLQGDLEHVQNLQDQCLIAYRVRVLESDQANPQEQIMDLKVIAKLKVKQVEGQVLEAEVVYDDIIYAAMSKKAIQESVKKVAMEGDFVTSFKLSPAPKKETQQQSTTTKPKTFKGNKMPQEPKVIDYSEVPQDQYRWKM